MTSLGREQTGGGGGAWKIILEPDTSALPILHTQGLAQESNSPATESPRAELSQS